MRKILSILFVVVFFSCKNKPKIEIPLATKNVEHIDASPDQQTRRKESEAICTAHGVPIYKNPTAMFVEAENEVKLRTQDEVVNRALALCYIGLMSEDLEQDKLDKIDNEFEIMSKLSPEETKYVNTLVPSSKQTVDANWRYESLHVLLWALGYIDSLDYPDKTCDVAADVKIIHDRNATEFRTQAKLRSKKEILDQADLILRLHWACVESQMKNEQPPGNLDQDVIAERHHALNWLIRYLNQDWDNVSTDT